MDTSRTHLLAGRVAIVIKVELFSAVCSKVNPEHILIEESAIDGHELVTESLKRKIRVNSIH